MWQGCTHCACLCQILFWAWVGLTSFSAMFGYFVVGIGEWGRRTSPQPHRFGQQRTWLQVMLGAVPEVGNWRLAVTNGSRNGAKREHWDSPPPHVIGHNAPGSWSFLGQQCLLHGCTDMGQGTGGSKEIPISHFNALRCVRRQVILAQIMGQRQRLGNCTDIRVEGRGKKEDIWTVHLRMSTVHKCIRSRSFLGRHCFLHGCSDEGRGRRCLRTNECHMSIYHNARCTT